MDQSPSASPRDRYLPGAIRVVYEDDDVMVIDKPSGMLTSRGPGVGEGAESVFDAIKFDVKLKKMKRGTRVWIIHRLDKEASGLLVFAKTERAFVALKEELRAKRMHRLYAAVVEGSFDAPPGGPPMGTVQSYLVEDDHGMVRSYDSPVKARAESRAADRARRGPMGAKPAEEEDVARLAVTHYQVAAQNAGRSLLHVRLETGRKHQIRAHMAQLSRPIVGDRRYGAATDPLGRVCLHARELGFAHPASGAAMRFVSLEPRSFGKLVGEETKRPRDEETKKRSDEGKGTPGQAVGSDTATPPSLRRPVAPSLSSSWDHVAEWYDQLLEDKGSDHHEHVILPGTLRLLEPREGQRVLDVACGQGILARRLAASGVDVLGVDASPRLIEAASRSAGKTSERGGASRVLPGSASFRVWDARELAKLDAEPFDAAACVMALMNINPLDPVLRGVSAKLKAGGRFVGVVLHPAFRAPGQTSWQWDEPKLPKNPDFVPQRSPRDTRPPAEYTKERWRGVRQYRRVDGYLTPAQREIVMNPGEAAGGKPPVTTITYHRPVQAYVRAFAEAGLLVDALEEWASIRASEPGPRAAEENRARREIPMFLAIRGRKA